MATLSIPEENRTISEFETVRSYLAGIGIDFEHWEPAHAVPADASAAEVLAAYSKEIDRLKTLGGYVTADVIDVSPATPGLEVMLNRFNSEHWHDEDEVRFTIEGRGLFHIRPRQGPVISITVESGDLIRVPRGTLHWFDLCQERRIRAVRLFQDPSGWTPHYTESGVDKNYQPVCLGPSYLPPRPALSSLSLPFEPGRTHALLLDIEGTTTPISYVSDTLFPFAAAHVEEFLQQHSADNKITQLMEQLRVHWEAEAKDRGTDLPPWTDASSSEHPHSAAAYVRYLIKQDSKITPLKSLQGRIWEAAYRSGNLRGEVYPDVPLAFNRWRAQGRRIAIFSSGSILAQQLLFAHSTAGDLTRFLDAFFDTTTGSKHEAQSYRRVAAALSSVPGKILFLSDATAELDAARAAGMETALSLRPELKRPAALDHPCFTTFDDVFP